MSEKHAHTKEARQDHSKASWSHGEIFMQIQSMVDAPQVCDLRRGKKTCTLSEMFSATQNEGKKGRELNSTFLAKKPTANLFSATQACWGSPLCHCSNNNMWFGCTAPVYSGKRRGAKLISDSAV